MRPLFDPILFDLDGTLVDSGRDIANAVNHAIAGMGLEPLPDDEVLGYVGDGVRRLMERLLRRLGRDDLEEQIRIFRAYYRAHSLDHTRPYPGIVDLLGELRGARLGVITNKPGAFARMVLEGLGLTQHFGAVIGGDETERIKPHPDPLLLACEQLGTTPERAVMIGDYPNDIQAGRRAGMTTCGVLWGFVGPGPVTQAGPDYLCQNAEELRKILFG